MVQMILPNWFLLKLSDTALLSLTVISRDDYCVIVEVDQMTAKMWRKSIQKSR